jgi:ribosome-binding protein aMBF1 (putative translation factor)
VESGEEMTGSFEEHVLEYKNGLSEVALLRYEARGIVDFTGARIAVSRVDKGLTQRQLANLVHMDQGDISRIENGEISATLFTLGKIFYVLDLEFALTPRAQVKPIKVKLRKAVSAKSVKKVVR